jgi:hypothetical protein
MRTSKNPFQRLLILTKREYWEHKRMFLFPLMGTMALILLVSLHFMPAQSGGSGTYGQFELYSLYLINLPLLVITWLIIGFYLLTSLNVDRQDNSILFWQSLPISTSETVLSKCLTAVVLLPLLLLGTIVVNSILLLIINSIVSLFSGFFPIHTWSIINIGHIWLLLARTFGLQFLIYCPVLGWLLFCSAYFKTPILYAIAIPTALSLISSMVGYGTYINHIMANLWMYFNATWIFPESLEPPLYTIIGIVIGVGFTVLATLIRAKTRD